MATDDIRDRRRMFQLFNSLKARHLLPLSMDTVCNLPILNADSLRLII